MLELIDPIAYRCGLADYISTDEEYCHELFVNEDVFYMSEESYNECVDILAAETEEKE